MYGRQTETAIAAVSRLAEVYDGGTTRLSASEIAQDRGLQAPSVAKILTTLSQAGLVGGMPGPGGGYALSKEPQEIFIRDVFALFEREEEDVNCPFGGGVCGVGEGCAIHEKLVLVKEALIEVLDGTTFEVFRVAFQDDGKRANDRTKKSDNPRTSYRAGRRRTLAD